jgi:hypothetical protein
VGALQAAQRSSTETRRRFMAPVTSIRAGSSVRVWPWWPNTTLEPASAPKRRRDPDEFRVFSANGRTRSSRMPRGSRRAGINATAS